MRITFFTLQIYDSLQVSKMTFITLLNHTKQAQIFTEKP